MDVASRHTSRLLQSSTTTPNLLLLQNRLSGSSIATATSLNRISRRTLTTSPRRLAPETSVLSLAAANPSHGGGPPTYFTNRTSLPANTIIRFVPQQTAWIVERMGKFHRILEPGLALLIPFLDRIAYVKSLKESAVEIPSQSAITSDNVTLELDGVLYTRVFDAYKASYGVEDAEYAITQLAQTTMRSEIGQLTLDNVLKERTTLNTKITQAINEAAQAWGVTCLRYEIRDFHPPEGVVEAMHRQVTAERAKRAEILESEGQQQKAINLAGGEAEAIRLRAQASAQGIAAVAKAIEDGKENAHSAMSLSVAEKYVDAWSKLAREGTAVVVPGNVGDLGGMIANAMAVYGKVSEGQAKSVAAKALGVQETSGDKSEKSSEQIKTELEDLAEAAQDWEPAAQAGQEKR
ncbi:hypothetical protein ASPWEDRAFT_24715 [Aspergillus wentii DTO 134E9]|uniref:Band 7 domain-containing protein n=1 Tax=Aspergillus wentii DTO 134E9 TaxID=1073089 RepID=A0A1L9RV70_ASPWE|nr:uncharacterized protein ASPWEDRAFT_24715 [Aspergillus wentii DTO 134E9]KAI9928735.1 hypothetical protein MW887_001953 [Aspergillus wentii]OJJ38830.1 hypothetical protein ASPWEDRAFT_24715 [Aspergillus wentii DTO 134E9]